MNVVVCIKDVPDTETYIKIGADQKSINEGGVIFILNPYDEYAVEEALKIQEAQGGEVTALCVGSERADEILRSAVAMGVQKAARVATDAPSADSLTTAKMMTAALKDMEYELILLGKETIDDGSMAVGPMLGELLGIPCITLATKVDVADGKVVIERELESGTEVIEASLPCVITAQKGLNEPRYPSLRGKMMAKKAVIDVKEVSVDAPQVEIVSMQNPPARGEAKVVGEGVEAVPELIRLLKEEAQAI